MLHTLTYVFGNLIVTVVVIAIIVDVIVVVYAIGVAGVVRVWRNASADKV